MCLILVAIKSHPRYPLIVAANRDEFYKRPSVPAHFWKDSPDILGGRDLEKGGTWFGVNRRGQFAAVTNFRGGELAREGRSRGELVARYLLSQQRCADFMQAIERDKAAYNPFNLIIGDGDTVAYTHEGLKGSETLTPGVHVIGNDRLDSDHPKIRSAREDLTELLGNAVSESALLELLRRTDTRVETGDPFEETLSAYFIQSPDFGYGTRATTLLLTDRAGRSVFCEQQFDESGPAGELRRFELDSRLSGVL